jgi:hypothetical protein
MPEATPAGSTPRQRQAANRRRRIRAAGLVLLFTLVGLVVGFGTSPFFSVESIVVEAPTTELRDQVAAAVRPPPDLNLLTGDLRLLARQAEAVPEVGKARVWRRLPRELVVTVTRRVPIVSVESPDGLWLADEEGRLLRQVDEQPSGMPLVRGLDLAAARPGWYLHGSQYAVAAECVRWMRRLTPLKEATVDLSRAEMVVVLAQDVEGLVGPPRDVGRKLVLLASSMGGLRAKGVGRLQVDVRDPANSTWQQLTPQ